MGTGLRICVLTSPQLIDSPTFESDPVFVYSTNIYEPVGCQLLCLAVKTLHDYNFSILLSSLLFYIRFFFFEDRECKALL